MIHRPSRLQEVAGPRPSIADDHPVLALQRAVDAETQAMPKLLSFGVFGWGAGDGFWGDIYVVSI